jgi:hypothetical protein
MSITAHQHPAIIAVSKPRTGPGARISLLPGFLRRQRREIAVDTWRSISERMINKNCEIHEMRQWSYGLYIVGRK